MKKIALAAFLLAAITTMVFAEDITITTYYPAPYGSYNQLKTNMLAVGSGTDISSLGDGDLAVSGKIDRLEGMSFTLLTGWNAFKWLGKDISLADLKNKINSTTPSCAGSVGGIFRYDGGYTSSGIVRSGELVWVNLKPNKNCWAWNRSQGGLPIMLDSYYINTKTLIVNQPAGGLSSGYSGSFSGGSGVHIEGGLVVVGLPAYLDNAAASTGGLTVGAFYRCTVSTDQVCVVH